jgi:hypothetical protein
MVRSRYNLVPVHAIKTWCSGGIALLILNLGTRYTECPPSHRDHLSPGKRTQCPLNRTLVGPHGRFGASGERQNLLLLLGIEPRYSSHLALHWLNYAALSNGRQFSITHYQRRMLTERLLQTSLGPYCTCEMLVVTPLGALSCTCKGLTDPIKGTVLYL